jgi:hypothetical protein
MKLKDRLAVITGDASRMVRKLDLLEFTLADGGWAIKTNVMPRVPIRREENRVLIGAARRASHAIQRRPAPLLGR